MDCLSQLIDLIDVKSTQRPGRSSDFWAYPTARTFPSGLDSHESQFEETREKLLFPQNSSTSWLNPTARQWHLRGSFPVTAAGPRRNFTFFPEPVHMSYTIRQRRLWNMSRLCQEKKKSLPQPSRYCQLKFQSYFVLSATCYRKTFRTFSGWIPVYRTRG